MISFDNQLIIIFLSVVSLKSEIRNFSQVREGIIYKAD